MKTKIVFTGGGTAGHIYPGLAVADELKSIAEKNNFDIEISWLGCSKGMDKKIVTSAVRGDGRPSCDRFYGIPSGKLRRYFSLKNFSDLFKIAGGFFKSFFILLKMLILMNRCLILMQSNLSVFWFVVIKSYLRNPLLSQGLKIFS